MTRDPRVVALLDRCTPAAAPVHGEWARPMRLSVYVGAEELPEDLVISVRVLVRVGDDVVVCTNRDGRTHAWPGGRREPGETYADTACREVLEETGWVVDPTSIEPIGWMLLENLGEPLPPYPVDALSLVVTATASERAAEEWTDTEGYEVSSRLLPLADAGAAISEDEPMCVPFLELLREPRA